MKPIFRVGIAVVFLSALVSGRPVGAAQEDCELGKPVHAFHCVWDQANFQGNMKGLGLGEPADLAGQCVNFSIRSAANNGKSGFATLYLYEQPNCAGDSVSKLNAGESLGSVTAQSARFGVKGAYR
jgi:hypothetical protein